MFLAHSFFLYGLLPFPFVFVLVPFVIVLFNGSLHPILRTDDGPWIWSETFVLITLWISHMDSTDGSVFSLIFSSLKMDMLGKL